MIPVASTNPLGLIIENIRVTDDEFSDARNSIYTHLESIGPVKSPCNIPETVGIPPRGNSWVAPYSRICA